MTVDKAKLLKRGDFIAYRNLKYKVLNIKELRNAHTNEVYIDIKCSRKNEILWLSNEFAEIYY